MLLAGALVILLSLGVGGLVVAQRIAGHDLTQVKPAWMLIGEARRGDAATSDT